ncbi:hypothetical protein [Dactylosporangium sp. NPDC049140]|uniref:hypothetical protein n=1 Tax=Dactylosporangium sp. NPDC049140 TaxID=3155647 RepID=UPI00340F8CB5
MTRRLSLVEDLAFGTAIGLIAGTAARPVLWAWPILTVILLRRHLRTPEYPHRPPRSWSWAVVAVALWLFVPWGPVERFLAGAAPAGLTATLLI